jgi:hypothetical protein
MNWQEPTRLDLLRKLLAAEAVEKPPTTWLEAMRRAFASLQ